MVEAEEGFLVCMNGVRRRDSRVGGPRLRLDWTVVITGIIGLRVVSGSSGENMKLKAGRFVVVVVLLVVAGVKKSKAGRSRNVVGGKRLNDGRFVVVDVVVVDLVNLFVVDCC